MKNDYNFTYRREISERNESEVSSSVVVSCNSKSVPPSVGKAVPHSERFSIYLEAVGYYLFLIPFFFFVFLSSNLYSSFPNIFTTKKSCSTFLQNKMYLEQCVLYVTLLIVL